MYRKFHKLLAFDLICLATILSVVSVNTFLGAVLNLNAPYLNAIKYDYQSLPFFSLLAASLVGKCISLFNSLKSRGKLSKLLFFFVALGGLGLVAAINIFQHVLYASIFHMGLFDIQSGDWAKMWVILLLTPIQLANIVF